LTSSSNPAGAKKLLPSETSTTPAKSVVVALGRRGSNQWLVSQTLRIGILHA